MERTAVLEAWRAAWNARDAEALVGLADEQIELVTRRGTRHGTSALRELIAKHTFGLRLHIGPQDYRFDGDVAVSVGSTEWRSIDEDDAVVERQDDAAAAYTFDGDRIVRFQPYPDAATALQAEGFTGVDPG